MRVVRFLLAALLLCFGFKALAQVTIVGISQAELEQKPPQEQSALLAGVVHGASMGWKCAQARASQEQTYNQGSAGWLVQCDEGQDYWVLMPAQAGKGAVTLPCILARRAGTNCYANFRTVRPEHIEQCTKSPFLDRVIAACTSIIQSGRLADKPAALAIAYRSRAVAYGNYKQADLAIQDFDDAVRLDPMNPEGLYNRAVARERKGDFDLAIADLDKVLGISPNHAWSNYERGYVYLQKKDYDHAISDFNRAIQSDSSIAKAFRQRGIAYRAKGDVVKAEVDARTAAELEKRSAQPR